MGIVPSANQVWRNNRDRQWDDMYAAAASDPEFAKPKPAPEMPDRQDRIDAFYKAMGVKSIHDAKIWRAVADAHEEWYTSKYSPTNVAYRHELARAQVIKKRIGSITLMIDRSQEAANPVLVYHSDVNKKGGGLQLVAAKQRGKLKTAPRFKNPRLSTTYFMNTIEESTYEHESIQEMRTRTEQNDFVINKVPAGNQVFFMVDANVNPEEVPTGRLPMIVYGSKATATKNMMRSSSVLFSAKFSGGQVAQFFGTYNSLTEVLQDYVKYMGLSSNGMSAIEKDMETRGIRALVYTIKGSVTYYAFPSALTNIQEA